MRLAKSQAKLDMQRQLQQTDQGFTGRLKNNLKKNEERGSKAAMQ